jgi:septum site-determining protein MinD
MARVISFNSFHRGSGTSNLLASTAALLAASGRRVGVVDMDLPSPGAHILFGLQDVDVKCTVNDYLWKTCPIDQAVYDVTASLGNNLSGRVFLCPASTDPLKVMRSLREEYDAALLEPGLDILAEKFELDDLLVDTSAGIVERTLAVLAISDVLVTILRLDQQDYQGTAVTLSLARQLDIPQQLFVVNDVLPAFTVEQVQSQVEENYGCEVSAIIPHSETMLALASSGIFSVKYPNHSITQTLKKLVDSFQ